MAINDDDELSKLIGDRRVISRHDNWLFCYLAEGVGSDFAHATAGKSDIRQLMAQRLKALKWDVAKTKRDRESQIVPDGYLDWFENSAFFLCWLYIMVLEEIQQVMPGWQSPKPRPRITNKTLHPHLHDIFMKNLLKISYKERAVLFFDSWRTDRASKQMMLERFRIEWVWTIPLRKRLSWVARSDEEMRSKAMYETLVTRNPQFQWGIDAPRSLDQLLADVLWWSIGNTEIDLVLRTVTARLAQQTYREKTKDKKQINLMLSKTAVSKLDKLAKQFEISRTQAIEILIGMENDRGIYLKEKMDLLKRVNDVNLS